MSLPAEVVERLQGLLDRAAQTDLREPTAVTLATAGSDGRVSARVVLARGVDARGVVFYTNLESHKSIDLRENPSAALCFYWQNLDEQVRIEGQAELVSDDEADAYWQTRSRASQIGAWASEQSRPLDSGAALLDQVARATEEFGVGSVPRPPHWSGWRVVPDRVEFWRRGDARLHVRQVWILEGERWDESLLNP